jgi:predicted nucleotidyltransferase
MHKEEILNFLANNKEYLQQHFRVSSIGLFGSFAKDLQTNKSDIDIIVDMPSSFDLYYDLKDYLEKNLKRKIDLGLKNKIRAYIQEKIEKEIIYV